MSNSISPQTAAAVLGALFLAGCGASAQTTTTAAAPPPVVGVAPVAF